MAAFIEPLLQEQLWRWLETEREMTVDGEVKIDTGRIDLAAETSDGRYIGVELKRDSGLGFGKELYEQLHRYIESGVFDEVYFASATVDPLLNALENNQTADVGTLSQGSKRVKSAIHAGQVTLEEAKRRIEHDLPEDLLQQRVPGKWGTIKSYIFDKIDTETEPSIDPVSIEEGIRYLRRSICPTEVGVIHIPFNFPTLDGQPTLRELNRVHEPEKAYDPIIRREAKQLDRNGVPDFNQRGEPWIRHCVWRQYGGLPEGYVPNIRSSDQSFRPIDILYFNQSYDPTEILQNESGDVVGVEAKGEESFDHKRLPRQLTEFLATQTLTHLYLAVPDSFQSSASDLLETHDCGDEVGLITVDEQGKVTTVQEAPRLTYKHDGYMYRYSPQKIGYGDVSIENGLEVSAPFLTEEERERLQYSDAAEYASDLLTDHSDQTNDDGWILNHPPTILYPPESEFESNDTARAYLLRGISAAPYHGSSQGPKDGYVRLSLSDYEVENQFSLKLHFGQGSWEGGYISLIGEQVQDLLDILVSLETIEGGTVPGQGKYIDLEIFPYDREKNEPHRVSGGSGDIQPLSLTIESINQGKSVARLQLGSKKTQGVDVTITEPQRLDLLASISILRDGNERQLPGEYSSYPRIGPSGDNTWNIGSEIEDRDNPDPPSAW